MDIHKPKPIHGWRDFVKEIGIIVIGVSIALAGEQAVEKWREHRQYQEARDSVRYEFEINSSNIRRRELFESCLERRLDEIDHVLEQAESKQPYEVPSWIGDAPGLRIRFTAEAETAKSNLFSTQEQGVYGRFYSYLHSFDIEQDRERLAWGRLRMLEGRRSLSPEVIYGLRAALADARYENDRIKFLKSWVITLADPLNLQDRTAQLMVTRPKAWAHCLPMNMPKADALRISELKPVYNPNAAQ